MILEKKSASQEDTEVVNSTFKKFLSTTLQQSEARKRKTLKPPRPKL